MKFSVLLPTRNRLELLRQAIDTVRYQDDANWEIVVSDNASQEDVRGYVASLADPRIVYVRSDVSIPVTDNWNLALSQCTGDYIIMLGDDDGLLPGYFSRVRHLIKAHGHPEVLYTGALLFAYPGVIPGVPDGFLRSYEERSIYGRKTEPFMLSRDEAQHYVRDSLDFRVEFDFNMQFFLVSRAAVQRLQEHGRFFQSPYPDYYAANALLLLSPTVLIVPEPMVVIGISPKSFGFFYFNDLESAGTAFLNNMQGNDELAHLAGIVLPGTDMNTCWLMAMETLALRFKLSAKYARYRELQIRSVLAAALRSPTMPMQELHALRKRLTLREKWMYWRTIIQSRVMSARKRHALAARLITESNSHPPINMPIVAEKLGCMLDVFDHMRGSGKVGS